MKNHFREHLEGLSSLDIQDSLKLQLNEILFECLRDYTNNIPVREIKDWASHLEKDEQQAFIQYKNNPHKFLLWMFMHYKSQTIIDAKYIRLANSISKANRDDLKNGITLHIRDLIFFDAISYLGRLMGAWILSCPDGTIRQDVNFEKVAQHYQDTQLAAGDSPSFDILLGENHHKSSAEEKKLIFVLDYQLYLATDWWLSP